MVTRKHVAIFHGARCDASYSWSATGYTVHHRGRAGEWVEVEVAPGVSGVVVRGLPCGAPHHVYLTAWNSQGASAPSPVLVASTLGSRKY